MQQESFTQLVQNYQNLIFSVCVKMTGDYFAAEDLTQETFLSAFKNMNHFEGDNMKSWLCRIAANKCIDYSRQSARKMVPTEDETLEVHASGRAGPLETCLQSEVKQSLLNCCRQLKPPYDEIAKMYFYEECNTEEIAVKKQKNIKTIQTQIYRARGMLRKLYGKECGKDAE